MNGVLGLLGGIKAYLLVAAVSALMAGTGGFVLAWKLQGATISKMQAAQARAETAAYKRGLAVVLQRQAISDKAGAAAAARQESIRVVYRDLRQKVHDHVSPAIDLRYPVPLGLVRLHDAAARGVPADAVPLAAGQPDDAPSGIALSRLGDAIVDNYGACQGARQQLIDLQGWVRAQQALPASP